MLGIMSILCNESICKYKANSPLLLFCHQWAFFIASYLSCSDFMLCSEFGFNSLKWETHQILFQRKELLPCNMQYISVLLQISFLYFLSDGDVCFLDNKVGWVLQYIQCMSDVFIKWVVVVQRKCIRTTLSSFVSKDANEGASHWQQFPWSRGDRYTWYSTPTYHIFAFVYSYCSLFSPVILKSHILTN